MAVGFFCLVENKGGLVDYSTRLVEKFRIVNGTGIISPKKVNPTSKSLRLLVVQRNYASRV